MLVFELTAKEKSGLRLAFDYVGASFPDVFGKEDRENEKQP